MKTGHPNANIGVPVIVLKTADEVVNNSNALQDDDELCLPMLANETWLLVFYLWVVCVNAGSDFKWLVTVPSGATGVYAGIYGTSIANLEQGLTNFTTSNVVDIGANENKILIAKAIIVNGTTPGNVQLRWAQYAAVAADTTVKASSLILAYKLA
jgi:hypothetical protein